MKYSDQIMAEVVLEIKGLRHHEHAVPVHLALKFISRVMLSCRGETADVQLGELSQVLRWLKQHGYAQAGKAFCAGQVDRARLWAEVLGCINWSCLERGTVEDRLLAQQAELTVVLAKLEQVVTNGSF